MGTNSKIEWCTHTWNPWTGCTAVSIGCDNCYMFRAKQRFGQDPTIVVRSKLPTFNGPLQSSWKDGDRVFVCSWSDFFHPAADEWRDEAWEVMRQRPGLRFLILTKRPEFIVDRLPEDWGEGWPSVWLGVTAETQTMLLKRVPVLLDTPAALHFVSCEPLLGLITFRWAGWQPVRGSNHLDGLRRLSWIIAGAESGPYRRPSEIEWFRTIRDECVEANVPFFLKQMAQGKLVHMPKLDGVTWAQIPYEKET